jgi:hypothetical protein
MLSSGSVSSDDKAKTLPAQYECLEMVTRSGFGAFRLPRDLETGQRVQDDPTILGVG